MPWVTIVLGLAAAGCGGSGNSAPPPPPPIISSITSVKVEGQGAATSVNEGLWAQFNAQVAGTGAFSSSVTWSVASIGGGDPGKISATGVYSAPVFLANPETVTVTAASSQDPAVTGSLQVVVNLQPGTVTRLNLFDGGGITPAKTSDQFMVVAIGSGYLVNLATWAVNGVAGGAPATGTIDAQGLYTAPPIAPIPNVVTITATSVQNPQISASLQLTLGNGPPLLFQLSPASGQPGDTLTYVGQNLTDNNDGFLHFYFPSYWGTPIDIVPFNQPTAQLNEPELLVPQGAASGQITAVIVNPRSGNTTVQGSLTFTRTPTLRLYPGSNDLAAGESTSITARFVGGEAMTSLDWSSDLGSVAGQSVGVALFQAPQPVSASQIAHVTACVSGTTNCDTLLLQLLPLRITPMPAITTPGQSLTLSAEQGGTPIQAQWILAGPGTLDPVSGLYTPSSSSDDAGAVPVAASDGSETVFDKVIVDGVFPGETDRVGRYSDLSVPNPAGALAESAAVNSHFLFVCSQNGIIPAQLPTDRFIDVYDLTDPLRPQWVDDFESAADCGSLFASDSALYQISSTNENGFSGAAFFSIYNLSGSHGALSAQQRFDTGYQDASGSGAILPGIVNGILYAPGEIADLRQSPRQVLSWFPWGGIHFPLGYNPVAHRVYAFSQTTRNLEVWDTSATPPELVGQAPLAGGFPTINQSYLIGNSLFIGGIGMYDVSTDTPQLTMPFGWTRYYSGNDGNFFVTRLPREGCCEVLQTAATGPTTDVGSLYPGPTDFEGCPAVRQGIAYCVQSAGGIGVYDLRQPGGPTHNQEMLETTTARISIESSIIQSTVNVFGGTGLVVLSPATGLSTPLFSVGTRASDFGLADCQNTLYAISETQVTLWDASNLPNLTLGGSLPIGGSDVACGGGRLFVATSDSRLLVYDIAIPTAPVQIASAALPGNAIHIKLDGNQLLVADGTGGLLVFSALPLFSPTPIATVAPSQAVTDVDVDGTVALLAAWDKGLVAVDLTNPASPVILDMAPMPASDPYNQLGSQNDAAVVAVANHIVYVGLTNLVSSNDDQGAGMIPAFDDTFPQHLRMVGLASTSSFINNPTFLITPVGQDLYISADIDYEMHIVQPRNFFRRFQFPPALRPPLAVGPAPAAASTATVTSGEATGGGEPTRTTTSPPRPLSPGMLDLQSRLRQQQPPR